MRRLLPVLWCLGMGLLPVPASAQDELPVIGEVQVIGGLTLTPDTISYYLGLEG